MGSYSVTVEMQGFRSAWKNRNVLVVNTPLTVDTALEVGAGTEIINVEASAEALQIGNATIGNVVTQKAIVDLPLNGRNSMNVLHPLKWP